MTIVYSVTIIAFICCLIITPFVISMCKKHGLVDVPKDSRRVHSKPMPRCGGVAIFVSSMIALLVYYVITKDVPSIAFNMQFLGYFLGAILIFTMGIIDDIFSLRAKYKFIFELASIIVVFLFGIKIENIGNLQLGYFSFPVTFLWIITVQNAMNLIDGLDGLAAGITSRDYRGARYSIYCKYVGIKFTVIVIISRINIRFALNPRPFAALYTDPARRQKKRSVPLLIQLCRIFGR